MARDVTKRSRAPRGVRNPPGGRGGRLRLLAGVALVFVLGIGLGAVLGTWLARPDKPAAVAKIESRDAPYAVRTRAYRPPVRGGTVPEPAPEPPFAAPDRVTPLAPRQDIVAEVETKPEAPPLRKPVRTPEVAAIPQRPARATPTWLANAAVAPAAAGRPMIAVVIDDLGLSQARVRRTIGLPGPLTLAFLPYGHNLRRLAAESRRAGHELIIHVNMEPKDRDVDPGPRALLTSLQPEALRERLEWALGRFDGYIGISNHMGSRFTEWPDGMEVVIRALKRRGLLYLDSVTSTKSVGPALARAHGAAYASRDVFLDHDRNAAAVARQLAQTERIARRRGYAVAIGHPYDVTLAALKTWLPEVKERGFVIVPLSAIVRRTTGEG